VDRQPGWADSTSMLRGFLALTFGTLLSSQGTDAHRFEPLGPSWGNLRNVSPPGPDCQRMAAVPADPTHDSRSPTRRYPCERCRGVRWPCGPAVMRPVLRGARRNDRDGVAARQVISTCDAVRLPDTSGQASRAAATMASASWFTVAEDASRTSSAKAA